MSAPRATVLLPTRGTSPTLGLVLEAALTQTVRDLEVFVVGDGMAPAGRERVLETAKADARVRLFDLEKGERRGERHRHAVLAEARAPIVCYLTDDDLWLPDHVAEAERLLDGVDVAHAPGVVADREGGILHVYAVDLARPDDRSLTLAGLPRVHLSCLSHTLEAYRRLPHGWRPSPPGVFSDHHMLAQFAANPGTRLRSGTWPTVVNFPTAPRRDWSAERLVAEWTAWRDSGRSAAGRDAFSREVLDHVARDRARLALPDHRARLRATRWKGRPLLGPLVRAAARLVRPLRRRLARRSR